MPQGGGQGVRGCGVRGCGAWRVRCLEVRGDLRSLRARRAVHGGRSRERACHRAECAPRVDHAAVPRLLAATARHGSAAAPWGGLPSRHRRPPRANGEWADVAIRRGLGPFGSPLHHSGRGFEDQRKGGGGRECVGPFGPPLSRDARPPESHSVRQGGLCDAGGYVGGHQVGRPRDAWPAPIFGRLAGLHRRPSLPPRQGLAPCSRAGDPAARLVRVPALDPARGPLPGASGAPLRLRWGCGPGRWHHSKRRQRGAAQNPRTGRVPTPWVKIPRVFRPVGE
mmetsp:Transcript_31116/g.69875  ORF Transcript_31116/g.69875 Transcript_31116/m.69875 type:complete len:281 (+) Transcript_31116:1014-1856(+)